MKEQIGKIKTKSIIFAPIILPTPRSPCFLVIEVIVVISSGKLVPIATIVIAIIPSLTPIAEASSFAFSTKRSAPKTIPAAPSMNLRILIIIFFVSTFSSTTSFSYTLETLRFAETAVSYI